MPVVFTSVLNPTTAGQDVSLPFDLSTLGRETSASSDPVDGGHNISQTPQVWLDHQVREIDGALVYNWDAVEDLFPKGLLDDMFEAYRLFLHRLASEEEAWQTEVRQLTPAVQLEQRTAVNATESLVSDELNLIWRKAARREPRKAVRMLSATTTALKPGLRLPGLNVIFPPSSVDHECRPYEFGWMLYAWLLGEADIAAAQPMLRAGE